MSRQRGPHYRLRLLRLWLGLLGPFVFPFPWPGLAHARGRLAIIVGNNRGLSQDGELRYAENDARKVARVLTDLGQFRTDEIDLVLGKSARELSALLEKRARERSSSDDEMRVLFYYSGHSDGRTLHMDGESLPVDELRQRLGKMPADLRILIVDACRSGEITRSKGAAQGPAFSLAIAEDTAVKGSIIITSSSKDEVSQESDRLQGSFFTHYWVSGLYGGADTNSDGAVTLEEAYRFAHFRTVDQTIESHGGVQHPSYRFALTGQGDVVLSNLARSTATLTIETLGTQGQYFVLDPKRQLILTEMQRASSTMATVRLPPGRYTIRKREAGRFLEHSIEFRANQSLAIRDADMHPVSYVNLTAKGTGHPLGLSVHGPRLSFGLRSAITEHMANGRELTAAYQLGWQSFFVRPRFRVLTAAIDGVGSSSRHVELDFGGALGWSLPGSFGRIDVSLDGGLVLFQHDQGLGIQAESAPGGVVPVGGSGAGALDLVLPMSSGVGLVLSGRVGVEVFSSASRAQWSPLVGIAAGLEFLVR